MIKPAQEIVEFIRTQADPIKGNLWFDVIVGFKPSQVGPQADLEALGVEVLSELSGSEAFHRCVHVIGWLDFSLEKDFASMEELHSKFAEASDDMASRTIGLAAPLRRRYFEQAAADWRKLRESALSAAALHRFHNKQLAAAIIPA